MTYCFSEPTIDELLEDGLVQGLMHADRVDTAALRSMLRGLSSTLESRPSVQRDRYIPSGIFWARSEAATPRPTDDLMPSLCVAEMMGPCTC